MRGTIYFTDSSEQKEIDHLRMQEYEKATGFQVELATLKWSRSDDESFVMALKIDEKIVSTMRGEVIDRIEVLEKKLECPWSFSAEPKMPVLLLSRAATLSVYQTEGFNLLMRYMFLNFAKSKNISCVIGTFVSGSSRENTMRDMGYQFHENKLGWQQSTYKSLGAVTVAILDLEKNGERAMKYCEDRTAKQIVEYPFCGEFPELKIVSCL